MKKAFLVISLFFIQIYSTSAQVNLYNGLIAYYTFNNQTLNDSSGNNLHGVIRGPLGYYTADRFMNYNGAYTIAPASQITIPSDTLFQFYYNNFSVSFWIRNTESNGSLFLPYLNFYEASSQYTFSMMHTYSPITNNFTYMSSCLKDADQTIPIYCAQPPQQDASSTINPIGDGNWHFINFIRDSTKLKLYVDYYLVYSDSTNSQPQLHKITVDSIVISHVNYYLGNGNTLSFDDLMIYNRALTDNEVYELYTLTASLPGVSNGNATALPQNDINSSKVILYPNPVHNHFTIQCAEHELYSVQVMDLTGRLIWHNNKVSANYVVECSHWESGTYLIQLVDKSGKMFTQKLTKY